MLGSCTNRLLALFCWAFSFEAISSHVDSSNVITLDDAPWDFEIDPLDIGAKEQWADPTRKQFNRKITTPGAWQAQGVGNATDLMHHQYVGVGWYRKTLHNLTRCTSSSMACWLWIGGAPGGVMRSAHVWVNGQHVGHHVGYLVPLEVLLPKASTLTLAIAVDGRWNHTEDPLWGAGVFWNPNEAGDGFSFGGMGGIIGHTRLLLRNQSWIEDSVHITTNPLQNTADWQVTVQFTVKGSLPSGTLCASLSICEANGSPEQCVSSPCVTASSDNRSQLTLIVHNAKPWVPGTHEAVTNLYVARIALRYTQGGASCDNAAVRFGMRSVSWDGYKIMFNGERLFLRGYGDDAQYGGTVAPPTDKSFYLHQLAGMKSLGFNFIRLHTHFVPEEFFDACDELGMLVDPEFAMDYRFPCTWGDCRDNDLVRQVFLDSWKSLIQRMSHHPSIFAWVMSNEIGFEVLPMAVELYRFANEYDPQRPCWWGDGSISLGDITDKALAEMHCKNGKNASNRYCFADIIPMQGANSWATTLGDPDTGSGLAVDRLPKPTILHEAYDARTFPRLLENRESFANAPVKAGMWLNASIERMTALNLLHENGNWAFASEQLYCQFLKVFIENYRLDPATSGYDWWLGFDWFAASNGILAGHTNQPVAKQGISNDTILAVQSEIALLVRNPLRIQSLGYRPGDNVSLELLMQNFSFGGWPSWQVDSAIVMWKATLNGVQIAEERKLVAHGSIAQGSTEIVNNISFVIPHTPSYENILISAALLLDDRTLVSNSWTLPVFPAAQPAQACNVVVLASSEFLSAVQSICSNAKELQSAPDALPKVPFVAVTAKLSATVATALASLGGFAVLLNPTASGFLPICAEGGIGFIPPPGVIETFKQPWWMAAGTVGTLVYDTSLAQQVMRLGRILGFAFNDIITNSAFYTIDKSSPTADIQVHIRSLPADGHFTGPGASDPNVPDPNRYVTDVHSNALLFEAPITQGSHAHFLCSGLNIFDEVGGKQIPKALPQAHFILSSLIDYAVQKVHAIMMSAPSLPMPVIAPLCTAPPSFCALSEEKRCQVAADTSSANTCGGNNTIVQPVQLNNGGVKVHALRIKMTTLTPGQYIPLIYASASNATSGNPLTPGQLLASGRATSLSAGVDGWITLPLESVLLQPGIYWIGVLFSVDTTCFSTASASAVGPYAPDSYATQPFVLGPISNLTWNRNTRSITIYAVTDSDAELSPREIVV